MVRMKALDQHQRAQEYSSLDNIVTVEINNETIKKKGQWPWDRNTLSNEIIRMYQQGASLVVLPILFADADRGGQDKALAKTLRKTPTIIGQVPTMDDNDSGVTRGVAAVGADWSPWVYRLSLIHI